MLFHGPMDLKVGVGCLTITSMSYGNKGFWMSRRSLLAKRCCAYIMDTSSHTDAYMQNGAGVADGRARRRPGWEFTELLTAVKRRLTDRKDAACIDAAQRYPLSAELHVFVYPWSC